MNKIFWSIITILLMPLLSFAEEITFSANTMTGIAGNKTDMTTLSGNAYVKTSSIEIYANKIELSGKDFRLLEATGGIRGKNFSTNLEFTCNHISYDRETKIAILRDGVTFIDAKNDVTAKAEVIEYNQDTDIAILQININLTQKDNVCTSTYAIYKKKEQILNLSGNAQIAQGSDTFRAQEIELNLDTQKITLDGRVRGSVVDERKTEENPDSTATNSDTTEEATDE